MEQFKIALKKGQSLAEQPFVGRCLGIRITGKKLSLVRVGLAGGRDSKGKDSGNKRRLGSDRRRKEKEALGLLNGTKPPQDFRSVFLF
jgi:hypothetical protein